MYLTLSMRQSLVRLFKMGRRWKEESGWLSASADQSAMPIRLCELPDGASIQRQPAVTLVVVVVVANRMRSGQRRNRSLTDAPVASNNKRRAINSTTTTELNKDAKGRRTIYANELSEQLRIICLFYLYVYSYFCSFR